MFNQSGLGAYYKNEPKRVSNLRELINVFRDKDDGVLARNSDKPALRKPPPALIFAWESSLGRKLSADIAEHHAQQSLNIWDCGSFSGGLIHVLRIGDGYELHVYA